MLGVNQNEKYFVATVKYHAKVKSFSDDVMTLIFDSQTIANYFEHRYLKNFEESASLIAGKKISVEVEVEEQK